MGVVIGWGGEGAMAAGDALPVAKSSVSARFCHGDEAPCVCIPPPIDVNEASKETALRIRLSAACAAKSSVNTSKPRRPPKGGDSAASGRPPSDEAASPSSISPYFLGGEPSGVFGRGRFGGWSLIQAGRYLQEARDESLLNGVGQPRRALAFGFRG